MPRDDIRASSHAVLRTTLGAMLISFSAVWVKLADVSPTVSAFYRERLSPRFLFSVPLAVTGLFMIVGIRWEALSPDYRIGIAYGLATAFFYTGFLIVLRKLQSHASKPSAALSLMVVSASTALYLAMEIVRTDTSFAIPNLKSGVSLAALGLMSQTVGWLLITHSLPRIPAAIAGLLLLLQPALAFIWDVVFFARATSNMAWAGVGLALLAIYFGATSERKPPPSTG